MLGCWGCVGGPAPGPGVSFDDVPVFSLDFSSLTLLMRLSSPLYDSPFTAPSLIILVIASIATSAILGFLVEQHWDNASTVFISIISIEGVVDVVDGVVYAVSRSIVSDIIDFMDY